MVSIPPPTQPQSSTFPQPVSRQPILALSLETFGLGAPVNAQNSQNANAAPASGDTFQRAQQQPTATIPINPAASPQEQLQAAYLNAERARNEYLQLANQLNAQAYQSQASNSAALPGGSVAPNGFQAPVNAPQQAQQQLQDMQALQQQQQEAALLQQQQAAELARQQAEQQMQMQQAQAAAQQPNMTPPPGNLQDLGFASTDQLNQMIAQSPNLQDKVNAMAELSVRGQGNAMTYDLLKQTAMADTSTIPPGPEQQQANYVRQTALWTLGIMNAIQNAAAPTAQLPGLGVISQIISSQNTDPSVKVAAIQALQVMNRPQDPIIKQILNQAKKDPSAEVKARAQSALAGEVIPLPGQTPSPDATMTPPAA